MSEWNTALNTHDAPDLPVRVTSKVAAKAKQEVADNGNPNKYFHIMLNMADDDLDPYQYRLLGHYRRVCGETGACWESTRTTAKICKMSAGKVSKTRKELENCGYLNIEYRGDETCRITLIDRMQENIERYSKCSPGEHVHDMNNPVHVVNASVHEVKQRRTTGRRTKKEEPKTVAPKGARSKSSKPKIELPDIEAVRYFKSNYSGRMTQVLIDAIVKMVEQFGDETVRSAITTAIMGSSKGLNARYLEGVLNGWVRDGKIKRTVTPAAPAESPPDETPELTDEQKAFVQAKLLEVQQALNGNRNGSQRQGSEQAHGTQQTA